MRVPNAPIQQRGVSGGWGEIIGRARRVDRSIAAIAGQDHNSTGTANSAISRLFGIDDNSSDSTATFAVRCRRFFSRPPVMRFGPCRLPHITPKDDVCRRAVTHTKRPLHRAPFRGAGCDVIL